MSRIKKLVAGGVLAAAIMVAAFAMLSAGPASPEPAEAGDCSITIRISDDDVPEGTSALDHYRYYTKEITPHYSGLVCWFD